MTADPDNPLVLDVMHASSQHTLSILMKTSQSIPMLLVRTLCCWLLSRPETMPELFSPALLICSAMNSSKHLYRRLHLDPKSSLCLETRTWQWLYQSGCSESRVYSELVKLNTIRWVKAHHQ